MLEMAWTLLSQRQFEEAGDLFEKIITLNNWSHATYFFLVAGCRFSSGDLKRTQECLDRLPALFEKRKKSGRELPTETFIRKKVEFYKAKQKRLTGKEDNFAQAIKISPAEELGLVWNNHNRIGASVALENIKEWLALTPRINKLNEPMDAMPAAAGGQPELDSDDEVAVRALLVGVNYRTAGQFQESRIFLQDAVARQGHLKTSTWVGPMASFELGVLELRIVELKERDGNVSNPKEEWGKALKAAETRIEESLALIASGVDLGNRLDTRINMLKDEMAAKKEMVGI